MDRREIEMLKKDEGYLLKFWQYFDKNFVVIVKNMILKVCLKV